MEEQKRYKWIDQTNRSLKLVKNLETLLVGKGGGKPKELDAPSFKRYVKLQWKKPPEFEKKNRNWIDGAKCLTVGLAIGRVALSIIRIAVAFNCLIWYQKSINKKPPESNRKLRRKTKRFVLLVDFIILPSPLMTRIFLCSCILFFCLSCIPQSSFWS